MRKEIMWKSKKALSAIPPFADVEFSGKKLPLTFFPFLLRLWRRVKLGTQIKFFAGSDDQNEEEEGGDDKDEA